MELELLQSLVTLVEAKAPPVAPVKVAKDDVAPVEAPADDEALSPEKTHFIFRPKFDIYGNLEQTEDQELRRETKRVYTIFGREHERGAVYGVTSSAEREFKRIVRLLGISTDGEVTLERVKRAGFTLVGRIGVKRLMKRGAYVVSLVGPSDDQAPITFYTAKPAQKVTESDEQGDLFDNTDHRDVIAGLEAEAHELIERHASRDEVNEFKNKIRNICGDKSIPHHHINDMGKMNQRITKMLKAAGYR